MGAVRGNLPGLCHCGQDHFSLGFLHSSWSKNTPGGLVPWCCVVTACGLVRRNTST